MNESIIVSGISALSAIIIAYIVNVASKKVQQRKLSNKPEDRMERMFNGYERLIKQKDIEDERKAALIDELEQKLMETRTQVIHLEERLKISHSELDKSRIENRALKRILDEMREEYKKTKKEQQ